MPSFDHLYLNEWISYFPYGGFHALIPSRVLDYWIASEAPNIENRITSHWPGWKACWHRDEYEFHVKATKGLLQMPETPKKDIDQRLRNLLLFDDGPSPENPIVHAVKHLMNRHTTGSVQINTWALSNGSLELPVDTRRRILDSLLKG